MRDDMYKVIVERPRYRGFTTNKSRRFRNDEERGGKIGIKKGYTARKELNENLAPLKRWLGSQVNRPWDKVYSELCAGIDRRNTVQEHIFTHLDQYVARDTQLIDGKVYACEKWLGYGLRPIEEALGEFYVHPVTGILKANTGRLTGNRRSARQRKAENDQIKSRRRDLNEVEQLHKLDGIWYRVVLERMPPPRTRFHEGKQICECPQVWDVVRNKRVSQLTEKLQCPSFTLYGKRWVYARHKQQLSRSELKRYQLTNNAGDSRRCCFWRRCVVVQTTQHSCCLSRTPHAPQWSGWQRVCESSDG